MTETVSYPSELFPARPTVSDAITITLDDRRITGRTGQTIAGMMLAAGVQQWRRTTVQGAPRGVFCGIGVCFDCIVTVNGLRDVRACLRRARDGDVVAAQHDRLPAGSQPQPGPDPS